jgi:short-subunit dehydrogenase
MSKDLTGRVAVITGASSGIGRATAERFAAEGMPVVLGARRAARLAEVAEGIRRVGGAARAVETDVRQPDQVRRLVEEAVAAFGRLDVLVNNAGLGYFGPVESTPPDEARYLFDVNLMGTLHGVQAAVPHMRRQGSGHIINVASIVGKRATPGNGVYSVTKFAQVALSEALRLELASAGIRVSVVCPVSTTTEFFEVAGARSPLKFTAAGPTYSAAQVADAIVRCVRRPRVEVIVYRPARVLVILNAISPRLVDRILGALWRKIRPGLEDRNPAP